MFIFAKPGLGAVALSRRSGLLSVACCQFISTSNGMHPQKQTHNFLVLHKVYLQLQSVQKSNNQNSIRRKEFRLLKVPQQGTTQFIFWWNVSVKCQNRHSKSFLCPLFTFEALLHEEWIDALKSSLTDLVLSGESFVTIVNLFLVW